MSWFISNTISAAKSDTPQPSESAEELHTQSRPTTSLSSVVTSNEPSTYPTTFGRR